MNPDIKTYCARMFRLLKTSKERQEFVHYMKYEVIPAIESIDEINGKERVSLPEEELRRRIAETGTRREVPANAGP